MAAIEAIPSEELSYIMEIKRALSDPYVQLRNWNARNTTSSPFSFNGIQCDKGNHVVEIKLGNFMVGGLLPPKVSSLRHLTFLSVANNSITGKVPNDLANCTNLRHLDLASQPCALTIAPLVAISLDLEAQGKGKGSTAYLLGSRIEKGTLVGFHNERLLCNI